MVKHIVLWKIRDDDQKQKNIDHIIDILTALVGQVEGLVSVEMGYNFNTASDYDVVLYATLKNAAALKYYQNHPEHVKCKEFIQTVSVGRTAADYFYEEGVEVSRPFDEVPDAPAEQTDPTPANKIEVKVISEISKQNIKSTDNINTQPGVSRTASSAPNPINIEVITPTKTEVTPPPAPMKFEDVAPIAPAKTETPKKHLFGKKAKQDNIMKQAEEAVHNRKDVPGNGTTWTCPNCGKIMPKYVGTCGCGEPQPFSFDDDPPALQPSASAPNPIAQPQKPSVSIKSKEPKKSLFGKKNNINDTPLEQRSNTWTCPNCGKVMPKYVGTCGCGEPQPFSFDDDPPALQPDPHDAEAMRAAGSAYPDMKAKTATNPAPTPKPAPQPKKSPFGKKNNIDVTPLEQKSNTWTCPNCGKVMPKYVGTCGCGEPQPFSFDDNSSAVQTTAPTPMKFEDIAQPVPSKTETTPPPAPMKFEETTSVKPFVKPLQDNVSATPVSDNNHDEENVIIDESEFTNAAPTLQSYNPQTSTPTDNEIDPKLNFIKNDQGSMPSSVKPFGNRPITSEKEQTVGFNDVPPPAPMKFEDVPPPAPMKFEDVPPPAPMKFEDTAPPPAPVQPAPKKHFFGKKAKKDDIMRQAEEAVNNRKDVPGNGTTWTCPNCGKVMPKYVGTCGCGEQQPFDF